MRVQADDRRGGRRGVVGGGHGKAATQRVTSPQALQVREQCDLTPTAVPESGEAEHRWAASSAVCPTFVSIPEINGDFAAIEAIRVSMSLVHVCTASSNGTRDAKLPACLCPRPSGLALRLASAAACHATCGLAVACLLGWMGARADEDGPRSALRLQGVMRCPAASNNSRAAQEDLEEKPGAFFSSSTSAHHVLSGQGDPHVDLERGVPRGTHLAWPATIEPHRFKHQGKTNPPTAARCRQLGGA